MLFFSLLLTETYVLVHASESRVSLVLGGMWNWGLRHLLSKAAAYIVPYLFVCHMNKCNACGMQLWWLGVRECIMSMRVLTSIAVFVSIQYCKETDIHVGLEQCTKTKIETITWLIHWRKELFFTKLMAHFSQWITLAQENTGSSFNINVNVFGITLTVKPQLQAKLITHIKVTRTKQHKSG